MNIKAFFVDALTSALDLSIGTPDDVVRHVTPSVLATHLPRPLWARLFTACLGAPRVDAQLVVETIGIPNLCEHVPASIIWACIAEIGARSLGKTPDITVPPAPLPRAVTTTGRQNVLAPPPPPEERKRPPTAPPQPSTGPVAIGPSIPAPTPTAAINQPLADLITELESDAGSNEPRIAKLRPRSPTAERFRQSPTGVQRIGGVRRPQASASVPSTPSSSSTTSSRRDGDSLDTDTHVGDRDKSVEVDDSQLVDWPATDAAGAPAVPHDEDFSDLGRKR